MEIPIFRQMVNLFTIFTVLCDNILNMALIFL